MLLNDRKSELSVRLAIVESFSEDCVVKAIRFKKNRTGQSKSEGFGNYVIRTDRVELDESAISTIHRSLTTIEGSFRAMKSDLGLRPNYHKNEEATQAHIFLSVLAYHMVCPVLHRLSQSGLNYTLEQREKCIIIPRPGSDLL